MPVNEFETSWKLLKDISIASAGTAPYQRAIDVFDLGGFHSDVLVGQSIRNSTNGILSHFLSESGTKRHLPSRTVIQLGEMLWANKVATDAYVREAAAINDALRTRGVAFAFTKGIVCQRTLYGGTGARIFNDIDLMLDKAGEAEVESALEALGYQGESRFDYHSKQIVPLPRSERAMFKMYIQNDHLPHFLKAHPDGVPQVFRVDVAFSLAWDNSIWEVPLEAALERIRSVECDITGETLILPAMQPEYDLLFHVLHLFREGWFERSAKAKDVRLSQFADIWRSLARLDVEQLARFCGVVDEFGLEAPVAWVLFHADGLFDSSLVEQCGLGGFVEDEWVSSMCGPRGFLRWSGDMNSRLRDRNLEVRAAEAPVSQPDLKRRDLQTLDGQIARVR